MLLKVSNLLLCHSAYILNKKKIDYVNLTLHFYLVGFKKSKAMHESRTGTDFTFNL